MKKQFKTKLKRLRTLLVKNFFGFGVQDLSRALRKLGLQEGDVVLCHVAFNKFQGFRGRADDVVGCLQEVVGKTGTLLMPTMPFSVSALDYVKQTEVTDLEVSPSAMGLVTEIFRRMPGVVRSKHPTHPVAAYGPLAEEMVRDHSSAGTPCGVNSPFNRLLDLQGKIVFLGTGIEAMTFYHSVEELLEPQMPVSPFTADWFELKTRDAAGDISITWTRLYNPILSRHRDLNILLPELQKSGSWRAGQVGLVPVAAVKASEVLNTCLQMAASGRFCYRTQWNCRGPDLHQTWPPSS